MVKILGPVSNPQDAVPKSYVDAIVGIKAVTTLTGTATATANTMHVITFAGSLGTQTITLPSAPAQGTQCAFFRTDANAFTSTCSIAAGSGDTLTGTSPYILTGTNTGISFIYVGTTWLEYSNSIGPTSGTWTASSTVTLYPSVMTRDSSGHTEVTDPTTDQHAVSKYYHDQALVDLGLVPSDYMKLLGWFDALNAAKAGTGRAVINYIGASEVEGFPVSSWPLTLSSQLCALLRTRTSEPSTKGGRGFIGIPSSGMTYMWPLQTAGTGTLDSSGYGAKHRAYFMSATGQKATLTLAAPITSFDINHIKGASGGATAGYYKIDGGSAVVFSTLNGSNQVAATHIASAANSTIEVGWNAAGFVVLEGITEYNGDETSGVMVHNLGISGFTANATATGWQSVPAASPTMCWPQSQALLSPNLIYIELGANDRIVSVGNNTAAQFKTNLTALIAQIRAAGMTCPIILSAVWDIESGSFTYVEPWANYIKAMRQVAEADITVAGPIDHAAWLPATNATNTYGLYYTDQVHGSADGKGYGKMAETDILTIGFRLDPAAAGVATGDLTGVYPNPTVKGINGTALSGLATGIYKNTTGTGVPSIAVPADIPGVIVYNSSPTSGPVTAVGNACYLCGTGSGAFQVNLPNAGTVAVGTKVRVSKTTADSNWVTVAVAAGQTLNGVTNGFRIVTFINETIEFTTTSSTNWVFTTYSDAQQDSTDLFAPGSTSGYGYETFSRMFTAVSSQTAPGGSGRLMLFPIMLPGNATFGHIGFVTGTAGITTPTHWWFGIYDNGGNQLATTADQATAAWAGSTAKELAIATISTGASSTYTTIRAGLYYVGINITCVTMPGLLGIAAPNSVLAALTSPVIVAGNSGDTGQTTPPAFPHAPTLPTGAPSIIPYAWIRG